jgi:hypothetical protein
MCDKITRWPRLLGGVSYDRGGSWRVFNRKKLLMEKLYSISYGKNARYFLHFVKTINLKYSMPFFLVADTTI